MEKEHGRSGDPGDGAAVRDGRGGGRGETTS